jgi:predicted site-specific integrase-resolvase
LIKAQAVEVILIEDPDRLVHFGFSYLEEACSWQGVRLAVCEPPKHLEPTEELVQDLLTIVTVFAGRLYGHRAKGVRKLVQTALKECETEQAHGTSQQNDQAAP